MSPLQYLKCNVVQASSIDTFKHRLDRFWDKQNIKYDYTAKYTEA